MPDRISVLDQIWRFATRERNAYLARELARHAAPQRHFSSFMVALCKLEDGPVVNDAQQRNGPSLLSVHL